MLSFGGIVRKMPMLSAAFFLFGLATIAIPGSVAFAAEDMLVHGALELHPWLTGVMVLAMVLNAVTFMRAFTITFLGDRRTLDDRGTMHDLRRHEQLTTAALILTLFLSGIVPGPIVDVQTRAARDIARMEQASELAEH
jgi:NADH-quinone oxidoreductase subunit M